MAKVQVSERGCWLWRGKTRPDGYGIIRLGGADTRVHRAMYTLKVGPIPEGLMLDHLCRQPSCCNPEHLEPVTNAENLRRTRGWNVSPKRVQGPRRSERKEGQGARNAAKTHCPKGHPYDDENTRTTMNKYGSVQRWCRTCDRERAHRRPSRAKTPNPH